MAEKEDKEKRKKQKLSEDLWNAVKSNNHKKVSSLLKKGADINHEVFSTSNWQDKHTCPHPLHLACTVKNPVKMLKLLFETGIDVDTKLSWSGQTTLHIACAGDVGNMIEIVKYLVEGAKCNVDTQDVLGNTPVYQACEMGRTDIVRYLCENAHCKLDAVYSNKHPVHIASEEGHLDTVRYLVERANCDIGVTDIYDNTPLDLAINSRRIDVVNYLSEKQGVQYIATQYGLRDRDNVWIICIVVSTEGAHFTKEFKINGVEAIVVSSMKIEFENMFLRLDLEGAVITEGWKIQQRASALKSEITKSEVNLFRHEMMSKIPMISLLVTREESSQSPLSCQLTLNGVKPPNNVVHFDISPVSDHGDSDSQRKTLSPNVTVKAVKSAYHHRDRTDYLHSTGGDLMTVLRNDEGRWFARHENGSTGYIENVDQVETYDQDKVVLVRMVTNRDYPAGLEFKSGDLILATQKNDFGWERKVNGIKRCYPSGEVVDIDSQIPSDPITYLKPLRDLLCTLKRLWYTFGIELDLSMATCDAIDSDYDEDMKITVLLEKWLTGFPSIQDLLVALSSNVIDRAYMAYELEEKIKTGLLIPWSVPKDGGSLSAHREKQDPSNPTTYLKTLITVLWDVRKQCYNLGIELEVYQDEEDMYISIGDDMLTCMLAAWLKDDPKLGNLLEALRFPKVGRADLADQLEEKIQTGKLILWTSKLLDGCNSDDPTTYLKSLRNVLWDVREQWYNLGIELELSVGTCEDISNQHLDTWVMANETQKCFSATLTTWLQDSPKLEDLFEALRGPVMDRADLADQLKQKIETGKLIPWSSPEGNGSSLKHKIEQDPDDPTTYLKTLIYALWDVREQWYNLGIELDLSVIFCDNIAENHKKMTNCFIRVLIAYLKGSPKLQDLVEALRGPVMDRADLSDELEKKIETGELVQWNMPKAAARKQRQNITESAKSLRNAIAWALYDFNSDDPEELSFRKGDIMTELTEEEDDPDWWFARHEDGRRGLIPKNYIETLLGTGDRTPYLKLLRDALWDVRTDWHKLGLELKLSLSTCDEIHEQCGGNIVNCFTAMLKAWLKDGPKMEDLFKALRSPAVHTAELADQLEEKIKTGELVLWSRLSDHEGKSQSQTQSLEIQVQPSDVTCKPGEKAELVIKTNTTTCIYQWYFKDEPIPETYSDYEGSTLNHLCVHNCLSKHEGAYKCVVTLTGMSVTSNVVTLKTSGEPIGLAESKLLGEILQAIEVDFSVYGINTQELLDGKSQLTYEEIQFIMKGNSATQILSEYLKIELVSRLEEERLYQEAMAKGHKISLSYTKILALGPGQVGKSTFLYRLMGIMKGNIQTSDAKTLPQSSTGIAELHEACIRYTSMIGALTDKNWHVFDESTEIRSQLDGLIALLSKQTHEEEKKQESKTYAIPQNIAIPPDEMSVTQMADSDPPNELTKTDDTDTDMDQREPTNQTAPEQKVKPKAPQVSLQRPKQASEKSQLPPTLKVMLPRKQNIARVIREFETLQRECKHSLTLEKTTFHMLFNIADIGGQPAFLEMLPSLTIGPALYLVFMKLLEGLKTRYPAAFKCKENRGTKLCQNYTYTSEEVIFTALSSIACFGNSDEEVEMYVANKADRKKTNSLALLVGTHCDKIIDTAELAAIDEELRRHIEETDFYTEGLIHSQKFLRVNNYSAADEEIREHRQLLEDILTIKFRQYDIPARWLMLSICLKLLAKNQGTHEVSFDDCVEIGKHFQMSKEMVKIALQFLHKYIGLVMYFPNHPNLKNVVICDPQAVFTSISELIFKIYDPTNLQITEAQHDHFVQTGCFSPEDVKPVSKDEQTQSKLLSIATLIDLLVHLNIAAEVPSSDPAQRETEEATGKKPSPKEIPKLKKQESTDSLQRLPKRREFFFPAVLQTAEAILLRLKARGVHDEQLPEPICIRFKTGYMPLGFVCALSAKLLAERKFQLILKEGSRSLTYKNLLKFRYEGKFDVVMISGPKYCEIRVSRHLGNADFWSKDCCPQIKKTICDTADGVIRSMKHGSLYKLSKGYELAFKCPQHPVAEIGHEPLAILVYEPITSQAKSLPMEIQCCAKATCGSTQPLTPEMKMWFGEALPEVPLEVSTKPSLKGNVLKITAKGGSNPLTFQWFKDEEPLTDSACYSGYTTAELVIVGTDSELKGAYKCRVTDRKSNKKDSGEFQFDPLVLLLETKGLREREIKKLIEYGYETMEDLEYLEVDDASLKEVGLKGPEIRRVRDFLVKEFKTEKPSSHQDLCRELIHALHDVRAHWYLLGIQLEIDHPTLEVIRRRGKLKTASRS